jgi:formylmethanofuran dehydrogenase subunit D
MNVTERTLNEGDTVELGQVEASYIDETQTGSLAIQAVWSGEPEDYAVLTVHVGDGEAVDVPEGGEILAVTPGKSLANPRCWLLVPTSAYGGGA